MGTLESKIAPEESFNPKVGLKGTPQVTFFY